MFDAVAEAYDRERPSYPPELVDAACAIGGLARGSPVLEVGCGTGKLTEALVERGLSVEAVDPGPNMIAFARSRTGDAARFHVGRFEDVRSGASLRRRLLGHRLPLGRPLGRLGEGGAGCSGPAGCSR